VTILEKFLGQSLDDALLDSLESLEEPAASSLDQVLSEAVDNSAVLIQYIEELDQQEPEVVLALVSSLRERAGSAGEAAEVQPVVALLRMMAQDVRQEIATQAVQSLGELRLAETSRALQTLLPIVAPELRPRVERTIRKMQFRGLPVEPLPQPAPDWRALISPVSGRGHQSVWFIQGEPGGPQARFLNVLLSDRAGAVEALGHTHVPLRMLPTQRPPGYLHDIALPDGSGAMLMLEAAFDTGRQLVAEAFASNRETQIPVAGPLRFLSPWLWESLYAEPLPARVLPELPVEAHSLGADSGRLLSHPAFSTWTLRGSATLQAAEEALRHPNWDRGVWIRRLSSELCAEPQVLRLLSRRLESMSQWLLLAGDEERAKIALAIANELLGPAPQEQPFLQAVVGRDLEWTLQALQQNSDRI
jgi:hypothetical protein